MRISRRTSGGRGEYEISEQTATGVRAADLAGLRLILDFGNGWIVDTATLLTIQAGKPRLRRVTQERQFIQLPRQVAAALLMPHPVRQDEALGAGLPILRSNRYAIEHIVLGDVDIDANSAILHIGDVVLRNNSNFAEYLGFSNRVARVVQLWANSSQLPAAIADLLSAHQTSVQGGGP